MVTTDLSCLSQSHLVDFDRLAPEDGIWLGLNLAATQLLIACVDREGFLSKRGGWTDARDSDRIRITLQTSWQVLDMVSNVGNVGNETVVGGEA